MNYSRKFLICIFEFLSGELLELLNRCFKCLDSKNHNVNLRDEAQEDTAKRICDALSLLNYPNDFEM